MTLLRILVNNSEGFCVVNLEYVPTPPQVCSVVVDNKVTLMCLY